MTVGRGESNQRTIAVSVPVRVSRQGIVIQNSVDCYYTVAT